jgi:hypothetical protein
VLNDLHGEFGMAPAAKGSEGKMQHRCFPKLFMFPKVGMQVSLVTMSCSSPRTVASPPYLPLYIKDWLKEDMRFLVIDSLVGYLQE